MKLSINILIILSATFSSRCVDSSSASKKPTDTQWTASFDQQFYTPHCDFEYEIYEDWCYRKPDVIGLSYDEAVAYCRQEGGDLVSIHDENENCHVSALYSGSMIGLRNDGTGDISWSDGTTVDYLNLGDYFMEHGDYFGYCATIVNLTWTNAECDSGEWPFVCKKKPAMFTNADCPDPTKLHLDHGEVSSPGYPLRYYGTGSSCTYLIAAKNGQLLELTFTETDVGYSGSLLDYVEVYEGATTTKKLGTVDHNTAAGTTFTTAKLNRMLLKFSSQNGSRGRWKATFETLSPSNVTTTTMIPSVGTTILTTTTGDFCHQRDCGHGVCIPTFDGFKCVCDYDNHTCYSTDVNGACTDLKENPCLSQRPQILCHSLDDPPLGKCVPTNGCAYYCLCFDTPNATFPTCDGHHRVLPSMNFVH